MLAERRFTSVQMLLIGMTLALAGCASSSRIVSNVDPSADFSQFRTFGFMQPLGTDSASGQTLTSQHLVSAVTDELTMRGLQATNDSPDLLVNFFISTREVITSSPSSSASMHWRRGRYGTWSGWSVGASTTEVVQRTEGTLGVDIVDRARNTLVWEGAASKRVTNSTRENQAEVLDSAIADIFKRFP